jgi:competence protein ComEC
MARRPAMRLPPWDSAGWRRRLGWRAEEWGQALRANLEAELAERRGFLWLPVFFGLGILCYFALPTEPLLAALAGLALVTGAFAVRAYHAGSAFRLLALIAVVLAGAAAAKLRVDRLDHPRIAVETTAQIEGRVSRIEVRAGRRPRLTLDNLTIEDLAPEETPARIHVTIPPNAELPPIGTRIAVLARLMPVPGAALPGGYDARRAAYFNGIGATGFTLGGWAEMAAVDGASPLIALTRLRAAIAARLVAALPGQAGAVAAALLVGERGYLSQKTQEDLRASGLAHILAISGLHMGLVAGTAFFFVRALLALSPALALRHPIRKWAALAGLLAGAVYLALSGASVATVRAFTMAAVMFAAMLLDRPALSMRNLAIAAFIVLATQPESVVEPGFQMSFAAVAALIAGWEAWRERQRLRLAEPPSEPLAIWAGRAAKALGAIAFTTIIASMATAPYAAFHFHRVAVYSLIGNVLAMPVVSLLIMPFGLFALLLMPFGLEQLPLKVMGAGIDLLLAVAGRVGALEGAVVQVPPMSGLALGLMTFGLLWLCLWRRPWRLGGVLAVAVGLALVPLLASRPDLLVAANGTAVAVRGIDGTLRVAGSRAGSFLIDQWLGAEGGRGPPADLLRQGVVCDDLACHLTGRSGELVAHIRHPSAFVEDCQRATVVVTPLLAPAGCAAPLVIDAPRLARFGAHAVTLSHGSGAEPIAARVATSWPARPRPWHQPLP